MAVHIEQKVNNKGNMSSMQYSTDSAGWLSAVEKQPPIHGPPTAAPADGGMELTNWAVSPSPTVVTDNTVPITNR